MVDKKSLKINTILNAFRMMLTVLSPLITFPYISRIFSTDGIGAINYAQSLSGIFILIASLGIYTYGVREGAKVRDDYQLFSALTTELLVINFISMLLSYFFYFICIYGIESLRDYRELLILNGVSIFFTALGIDWIFGVYEEYKYITIRQIIAQILTLVLMFVFVKSKNDIYIWVLITVLCNVLSNVWNWFAGSKYFKLDFSSFQIKKIKKHILPISILFATRIAATLYTSIDTVLLGAFESDDSVGLYTAATKINTILITFFSAMSPVFIPRIVEYLKNDAKKYYELIKKIFNAVLILAIPIVLGIELISNEIILILSGTEFQKSSTTLRIIAPVVIINACLEIIYYDIWVPLKKEKNILYCTIISVLINIVISVILIPRYAENGVALGSLVSEFFVFVLAIYITIKSNHNFIFVIPKILNYLISSICMIIVIVILKQIEINYLVNCFLSISFGGIIYFLMLLLLKDKFTLELFESIKKKLKKK